MDILSKILSRFIIPVALVAGGVVLAGAMINSAPKANRTPKPAEPPVVDVLEIPSQTAQAVIRGTGTVEPARQVILAPEVSGKITSLSDHLVLGGRVVEGEKLGKIDARDYRIAIKQQKSQVESAALEVEIEEGRGRVAEREWDLLSSRGGPAEGSAQARLVKREPHKAAAEKQLESAKSGLQQAQIQLSRTTIKAPFNATITAENVEVGQFVQPGASLATLVGTDAFWIRVALPLEDLALIDIPRQEGEPGSKVRVVQSIGRVGGGEPVIIEREGRVVRLIGELDGQTRRAQVLVQVDDPLDPPEGQLPLLPGAFVEVFIEGDRLPGSRQVPREALVEGDEVLVADRDDKLARREVEILWGDSEFVYVAEGGESGDRVIVGGISLPIEGMELAPRPAPKPGAETANAETETAEKVEE